MSYFRGHSINITVIKILQSHVSIVPLSHTHQIIVKRNSLRFASRFLATRLDPIPWIA